ncbi:myb/SANT-like DNA-binding domain-containing protein 3 [Odontomachus brunneus]|uniref:myb/SANT-like DNA-binding domain-containing protein 3 n=1 Tax=Odontomachus brunneus TaxID=486640 RepID=UPI0013F2AD2A|nr:myb/SANT-like DNA-binding domain-containing protein 3 [Odontomachus brunneus]XP_032682475.1 myb/SANT-like DNA-binding domain-containing protein 3 [Odontomachus brunneus]
MATKSRHYTPAEKNVFLQILGKYKHIIECKRSCADTLRNKEAAWKEICDEFNNSSLIVQDRTVQQLKKLWNNLKQIQRDALTREKQARFATGGGPEELSTDIDPDIAMIAPNLMTIAPIIFTSNMNDKEMEDAEDNILEHISMNSTE